MRNWSPGITPGQLTQSGDAAPRGKAANEAELSKMVDGGVPFPMLSDAGGKVGAVYGVYDEAAGVDTRGRFIIDPDGVIQGFEVLTPPVGRNVAETIRQVQAFQLVRESKGAQATPSGWRGGVPHFRNTQPPRNAPPGPRCSPAAAQTTVRLQPSRTPPRQTIQRHRIVEGSCSVRS